MQHNLLKKYEDEVNSNAVKQDLINHMKIEIDQLESNAKFLECENTDLKKKLDIKETNESKLKTLKLDLESYKIKCKKYKNILKCFDENFFDELEDLKANFYESVKLNKHYENLFKKIEKKGFIQEAKKGKNKLRDKKRNRVKFALSSDEKCGDSDLNDSQDQLDMFKSFKQSVESMNKDYETSSCIENKFNSNQQSMSDSIDFLMNLNKKNDQIDNISLYDDEDFDYETLLDKKIRNLL